jgi:hypothetical protein
MRFCILGSNGNWFQAPGHGALRLRGLPHTTTTTDKNTRNRQMRMRTPSSPVYL